MDDMRNLFINAHHLLNLYRPHQARESLIMMMEEQLERTREEIQQMDKTKADIQSFLEQLGSEGINADSTVESTEQDEKRPVEQNQQGKDSQLVWGLLDEDT